MEFTSTFKSYLGTPLIQSDGQMIGTLCAIDSVPYAFSDKQVTFIQTMAEYLANLIEIDEQIVKKEAAERLVFEQNSILTSVAKGVSISNVLDELCKTVEKHFYNSSCSIFKLDAEGNILHLLAAPSLPVHFKDMIKSIIVGPNNGSCGTAAYLEETVIVSDINQSPLWDEYRNRAEEANIKSCLSFPIFSSKNKLLGTFAIYFTELKAPTEEEIDLLKQFSSLAEISIEKQQNEERINFLAYHDELTKVPNRLYFNEKFETSFETARLNEMSLAIMVLDLDDFKFINDHYGHLVGDEVLKEVTNRIQTCIHSLGEVARLGGDEFALLFQGIETKELRRIASCMISEIQKPIFFQGSELFVTSSIGISRFPEDGQSMRELMKYADAAMYRAKGRNKNGLAFYNE